MGHPVDNVTRLNIADQLNGETSQLAAEFCHDMWVWSIASPLRGQVHPPHAQCSNIFLPKT